MRPLTRIASLLILLVTLTGCDRAPDADATMAVLKERLAAALKPPVTEVASFRRLGSGPLPAGRKRSIARKVRRN